MKRTLSVAVCIFLAGCAAQVASAAMIAGQYVPDELANSPGTQYRLIFVTSGSRQAASTDPNVYDDFLADQVVGTMLGGVDYGWRAVLSTYGGARFANQIILDTTGVTDPDNFAGIYNTAGLRVAATGSAMLAVDPYGAISLEHPVLFDQHGTTVEEGYVWTGANRMGGAASSYSVPLTVGSEYLSGSATMLGAAGKTNDDWLELGAVVRGDGSLIPFVARVYGMSDVMTVPVPEPSTVVLWSLCTGIAGLVFWRKRRQSR